METLAIGRSSSVESRIHPPTYSGIIIVIIVTERKKSLKSRIRIRRFFLFRSFNRGNKLFYTYQEVLSFQKMLCSFKIDFSRWLFLVEDHWDDQWDQTSYFICYATVIFLGTTLFKVIRTYILYINISKGKHTQNPNKHPVKYKIFYIKHKIYLNFRMKKGRLASAITRSTRYV